MDPTLRGQVEAEIDLSERLLWVGRPDARRMILPAVPVFLFGVFWSVSIFNFIVKWYSIDKRNTSGPGGGGVMEALFFVPFVLMGLGMLSGPIWAYLRGLRTVYAITDKRVIILEHGWSRKVQSYVEGEVGDVSRTERADGSGDLTFGKRAYTDSDGARMTKDVKFVGIPDVREVERLIRETFAGKAATQI